MKKKGIQNLSRDGAFSRGALRHRKGDGFTPRKAKRLESKRTRQGSKKELNN